MTGARLKRCNVQFCVSCLQVSALVEDILFWDMVSNSLENRPDSLGVIHGK